MVDFYGPTHFLVEHTELDLCVQFQVNWTYKYRWRARPAPPSGPLGSYFLGIISSYWARLYKYVYSLFQLTEPLWQKKYNYWKWEISSYFYTSGSTLLWNIFCGFCSDWKNNFSFTVYSDLCYTTTIFFAFVTPLVFKLNFWFQVFMWTFVRTGPIVVDWDINKLYATFGKLGLVWGGELSKITLLGLNYSITLWPIWA